MQRISGWVKKDNHIFNVTDEHLSQWHAILLTTLSMTLRFFPIFPRFVGFVPTASNAKGTLIETVVFPRQRLPLTAHSQYIENPLQCFLRRYRLVSLIWRMAILLWWGTLPLGNIVLDCFPKFIRYWPRIDNSFSRSFYHPFPYSTMSLLILGWALI